MKKINIHGSCVSRDLFEYASSNIKVNQYIGRNSIFSSFFQPISLPDCFFNDSQIQHNWEKRMLKIDIEKNIFEILADDPGDYIIIDLIDSLFNLVELHYNGNISIVTFSQVFRRSELFDILAPEKEKKIIDIYIMENNFLDFLIESYCKTLLNIYRPEQIIIYEAYPVYLFQATDNTIKAFSDDRIQNITLKKTKLKYFYDRMKKHVGNSIVVKMPDNIVADANHRWGLASNHYEKRCYYEVMNSIEKHITV